MKASVPSCRIPGSISRRESSISWKPVSTPRVSCSAPSNVDSSRRHTGANANRCPCVWVMARHVVEDSDGRRCPPSSELRHPVVGMMVHGVLLLWLRLHFLVCVQLRCELSHWWLRGFVRESWCGTTHCQPYRRLTSVLRMYLYCLLFAPVNL